MFDMLQTISEVGFEKIFGLKQFKTILSATILQQRLAFISTIRTCATHCKKAVCLRLLWIITFLADNSNDAVEQQNVENFSRSTCFEKLK